MVYHGDKTDIKNYFSMRPQVATNACLAGTVKKVCFDILNTWNEIDYGSLMSTVWNNLGTSSVKVFILCHITVKYPSKSQTLL